MEVSLASWGSTMDEYPVMKPMDTADREANNAATTCGHTHHVVTVTEDTHIY